MDHNVMTQAVLDMKTSIGRIEGNTSAIKEKIDAHDTLLQGHTELLNTIDKRTIGMDSWKNGIIHNIVEQKESALAMLRQEHKDTKEEQDRRLKLLEEYKTMKEASAEKVKSKFEGIMWGGVEKILYIVIGGGATLWLALKAKFLK